MTVLAALVAAVSVVVAPLVLQLHESEVRPVRCLEHGELVEFSRAESAQAGPHHAHTAPLATKGLSNHQDQHCTLHQGVSPLLTLHAAMPVVLAEALTDAPILRTAAPRAPPLTWAPKTSPPLRA